MGLAGGADADAGHGVRRLVPDRISSGEVPKNSVHLLVPPLERAHHLQCAALCTGNAGLLDRAHRDGSVDAGKPSAISASAAHHIRRVQMAGTSAGRKRICERADLRRPARAGAGAAEFVGKYEVGKSKSFTTETRRKALLRVSVVKLLLFAQ